MHVGKRQKQSGSQSAILGEQNEHPPKLEPKRNTTYLKGRTTKKT